MCVLRTSCPSNMLRCSDVILIIRRRIKLVQHHGLAGFDFKTFHDYSVFPIFQTCRQVNTEAWDVFMTVSRDSGIVAAQCFEGPVRIVKCMVYLLFFVTVLSCTFASKVSLVIMTTGAGDMKKVIIGLLWVDLKGCLVDHIAG